MRAVVDSMGRVVIPKSLRDELGLVPGTEIDISRFGGGVHIEPGGRTASLRREGKYLVVDAEGVLDPATVYALIDAGRR